MLSVLRSPQAGTSQGQSMGQGGASSETRDWFSGHVRPGLGGAGPDLDVRNPSVRSWGPRETPAEALAPQASLLG